MENSPFLYSSRRVSLPWFIVFEFKLARVVSYPRLDEWIIKRSTSAIGTFFSRPSEEKPRSNGCTGEKTLVLVEVNVRPNCWRKKCARLLWWPWRRAAGLGTVRHNNATSNCRYLERYGFFLFFFFSIYLLTSLTNNDHGDPLTLSLIFQERFFFFVRFFFGNGSKD